MNKWKLHSGGVDIFEKDGGFCGGHSIVSILNDKEKEIEQLRKEIELLEKTVSVYANGAEDDYAVDYIKGDCKIMKPFIRYAELAQETQAKLKEMRGKNDKTNEA